jgi:hypothetical protein
MLQPILGLRYHCSTSVNLLGIAPLNIATAKAGADIVEASGGSGEGRKTGARFENGVNRSGDCYNFRTEATAPGLGAKGKPLC